MALLTYDDSVKRLIFGKKLQNHDVITGLLRFCDRDDGDDDDEGGDDEDNDNHDLITSLLRFC